MLFKRLDVIEQTTISTRNNTDYNGYFDVLFKAEGKFCNSLSVCSSLFTQKLSQYFKVLS